MTVVLSHPACSRHDPGPHVERPERLAAIERALAEPPVAEEVARRRAEPATRALLERVHSAEHVDAMARLGEEDRRVALDPDTVFGGRATWEAALAASGAAVDAARVALDGTPAFALTRPPGHHATPEGAMGFCIFNNVAIAAEWALAEGGARRVAILDVDVHHGNGTQDAFYGRGEVLYVSLHQSPFYPGTGHPAERGAGEGRGATVNLPLTLGTGDTEYARLMEDEILPEIILFEPDLLLVSAGYDAHERDPIGGLCLTTPFYGALYAHLLELDVPVAGVLEGGYDVDALAASVTSTVRALAGHPPEASWESFLTGDSGAAVPAQRP